MPLAPHKTWEIYDSSKLREYLSCPRKYFYEYVLGWQPTEPSIHLEFGSAWHILMEQLLLRGYSKENIEDAMIFFKAHFRKFFAPNRDIDLFPKNPATAEEMARKYVVAFADDIRNTEVLYTETSGSVPISAKRSMQFRVDAILRYKGIHNDAPFIREHKTASKRGALWNLRVQIGCYNHVGHCLYNDFRGVEVNEAIFQKTKPEVQRTFVARSWESMESWLWQVNSVIDDIERDYDRLSQCTENDICLKAFRCVDECTTNYGKCKWYDYCMSWANPLQHLHTIPQGMAVRYWDPSEQDTTNKLTL